MRCANCEEAEMELIPIPPRLREYVLPTEHRIYLCPECDHFEPASERA